MKKRFLVRFGVWNHDWNEEEDFGLPPQGIILGVSGPKAAKALLARMFGKGELGLINYNGAQVSPSQGDFVSWVEVTRLTGKSWESWAKAREESHGDRKLWAHCPKAYRALARANARFEQREKERKLLALLWAAHPYERPWVKRHGQKMAVTPDGHLWPFDTYYSFGDDE